MPDEQEPRPFDWRTGAGVFLLLVAVVFFAISGVDQALFGVQIDLDRPAWILFGVGSYVVFGLKIADILDRRP